MSRPLLLILLLGSLLLVLSCSGEKEQPPVETARTTTDATGDGDTAGDEAGHSDDDGHVHRRQADKPLYPPANPYGSLTPEVLDTLRILKKEFEITVDKYWENKGGVLANDFFEVWYPAGRVTVTHGMHVFTRLMPAREKFLDYFGDSPAERLVVTSFLDMDDYVEVTGKDWWFYSVIEGDSMVMQPYWVLVKRNIDKVVMSHEYYQWAVGKVTRYAAPRWLEEGIASWLSEEKPLLERQMLEFIHRTDKPDLAAIDNILTHEEKKEDSRVAYYHSLRMVEKLIDTYGEDKFKEAVRLLAGGETVENAFGSAFGASYDQVMNTARDYTVDMADMYSRHQ